MAVLAAAVLLAAAPAAAQLPGLGFKKPNVTGFVDFLLKEVREQEVGGWGGGQAFNGAVVCPPRTLVVAGRARVLRSTWPLLRRPPLCLSLPPSPRPVATSLRVRE